MKILFYLFKAAAWLVSWLPFRLLYVFSDILRFIIRFILKYRQNVIFSNLRNAFPDLNDQEIKKIIATYYRNLADIILEVIKLRHVRPDTLKRRFTFENYELMTSALVKNRSVIIAIGHCGNWEWMGTTLGLITPQKGYALIKPLSDRNFNDYMETLRHRLNRDSTLLFKSAFREMVRRKEEPTFYVVAADQTPTQDEATYWTNFFNQDTPFFLGIEKIAKSLDFDVFFMDIRRTGRGKYCGDLHLISNQPGDTGDEEITETYVRMLEAAIRRDAANWLWSHRRWKYSRNTEAR